MEYQRGSIGGFQRAYMTNLEISASANELNRPKNLPFQYLPVTDDPSVAFNSSNVSKAFISRLFFNSF